MKKKLTIPQIKGRKASCQKTVLVTAYDYPSAVLAERAGIEIILVGDSLGMTMLGYDTTVPVTMEDMIHHTKPVVKGAPGCFVIVDMPFGSYNVSIEEAIRNANRLMQEGGADGVKLEGGREIVPTVKAMVNGGIPVMAHIGLTPQTVSQLGGYKVQGTEGDSAQKLLDDALSLENAGAFSIVLECVPAPLAKLITEKVTIPTIGIGAGADCDGQVLVYHDILGLFDRFVPKFVKRYANIGPTIVEALSDYAKEVRNGQFPDEDHSFGMAAEEIEKLY